MASSGALVTSPWTYTKPAWRSRAEYSARVRSLPSVQTSMLRDCISAGTGPVLSLCKSFSAIRRGAERNYGIRCRKDEGRALVEAGRSEGRLSKSAGHGVRNGTPIAESRFEGLAMPLGDC